MTVIYKLSRGLILFLSLGSSLLAETTTDINSYCFDSHVNLKEVHRSLTFLLLPKDNIDLRTEENCLDVVTTTERAVLIEKYLGRRYRFKKEMTETPECRLNLKTTQKIKTEGVDLKVGKTNSVGKGEVAGNSISTMEILLSTGKPGEIEVGGESLKIVCRLIGSDNADLTLSYVDKNKASISTQVQVKKGEWLNIATALKDMSSKAKNLAIPQLEMKDMTGNNETIYEIQFK